MTLEDIDSVELIGGGMRVPRVQEEIQKTLGSKLELGLHINSDESMALGAAFHGANISTAFRVRHVGMTDVNPFAIAIGLQYLDDPSYIEEGETEPWQKSATLFKSFGKVGIKKTIAFSQDKDVHCQLNYEDDDILPKGTQLSIAKYNISGISQFASELAQKGLGKPKVALQFELSTSGIPELVRAEATVEETYTVTEEVEVEEEEPPTQEENKKEENVETSEIKEGETSNTTETEDKAPKKKKTKVIEKEKKRTLKRKLDVTKYHTGRIQPYSPAVKAYSKSKLEELAAKDKARIMLEEAKNNFEAFIYHVKNKLSDDEEDLKKVSTDEQREELLQMAIDANDWLDFEGWDADLETYQKKLAELSAPAKAMFHRLSELTLRPQVIAEVRKSLTKVEDLMNKWETTMPQVTEEERAEVLAKVEEVRKWVSDKEDAQAAVNPWDPVVFNSTEVPLQTKSLEKLVAKLGKKPKPKPPVIEKNETAKNETSSEKVDTEGSAEGATEGAATDGATEEAASPEQPNSESHEGEEL